MHCLLLLKKPSTVCNPFSDIVKELTLVDVLVTASHSSSHLAFIILILYMDTSVTFLKMVSKCIICYFSFPFVFLVWDCEADQTCGIMDPAGCLQMAEETLP